MKVLVVSDIHGNFEALRRIPESFDRVLFLGDAVDYGPDPKSCLNWLRERGAVAVRGNHDQAVAAGVSCRCNPSMREASEATRDFTRKALDDADLDFLLVRPLHQAISLGGVRFHLVHATPSDPLYTYLPPTQTVRWAAEANRVDADLLLVGHTHLPMILRVGRKLVVNPGSVGQPRDGDPRAAYAVIEDGEPRLERVTYDISTTIQALEEKDLPPSVFADLSNLLETGVWRRPK